MQMRLLETIGCSNKIMIRAKETMELLAQRCPKIMDWPSDINPIENLWANLENRVEQQVNKLLVKKSDYQRFFS
jgi:hypothetical protein